MLSETNFVCRERADASLLFGYAIPALCWFDISGYAALVSNSFEISKNLQFGIEFAPIQRVNVTL